MAVETDRSRAYARKLLGVIRLVNGAVALVAPNMLAGRVGVDVEKTPAAGYFVRLFGIRTVLIAIDLFVLKGDRRKQSLREGVLIHGSDTVAAAIAARSGKVPGKMGLVITLISLVNTALAIYASSGDSSD